MGMSYESRAVIGWKWRLHLRGLPEHCAGFRSVCLKQETLVWVVPPGTISAMHNDQFEQKEILSIRPLQTCSSNTNQAQETRTEQNNGQDFRANRVTRILIACNYKVILMVSGCGFLCFEKQKNNLTKKSLRTWITDHCQQISLSKRRFCGMDLLPFADRNQNKQDDKTVLIPTPLLWRFVVRVTRSEFRKFPLFHLKAINRIFPRPNKVFLAQQTCYQAGAGEHHFWSSGW